jgi:hypothetical protein
MNELKSLSLSDREGVFYKDVRDCEDPNKIVKVYDKGVLVRDERVVAERYKHFKGNEKIYSVVGIIQSKIPYVIYEQLYEGKEFPRGTFWMRGLEDFVGFKEMPDGKKVKRFELVGR